MTTTLNQKNPQQCLEGFKTVAIIGGPMAVAIHKAMDAIYEGTTRSGYFITVDLKFRQSDALIVGKAGWEGFSKTEATREANRLANEISIRCKVLESARESALNWDTVNNNITVRVQEESLNKVVGKYNTEIQ